MLHGDRRIDADTFLSSGFGIRTAIESHPTGWVQLGSLATFWTPPRIKIIEVSPEHGIPYLNTSQVFDVQPTARKFLSRERTTKSDQRLSPPGTILIMASASVGRSTITTDAHDGCFISHHFMRANPNDAGLKGWIYAFIQSPHGQAMLRGSQYASIIRHIEPHHVAEIPVPKVESEVAEHFNSRFAELLSLRNQSYRLSCEANAIFSNAIGHLDAGKEAGFSVPATALVRGRRRLEANYYHPDARAILSKFKKWQPLSEVCDKIWWMPRFKRFYGDDGLPYLSADELFTTNRQGLKRILVDPDTNYEDYFVHRDWIVMACSGQTYGLNGAAMLITEHLENIFMSHDLIRIVARKGKVDPGYLVVALTNRTHGRPLLIRAAYGTSIPHLDPGDVADFPVVRLGMGIEGDIAELATAAAKARDDAERLEFELATEAGNIVEDFIQAGPRRNSRLDTVAVHE